MPRLILATIIFSCCLAAGGCVKFQPIMTPQEFAASCQAAPDGADPACAARVCDVYQAVVTDYHEDMASCQAVCRQRAEELLGNVSAQCRDKVEASRDLCLEFCDRKFYRCNCTK